MRETSKSKMSNLLITAAFLVSVLLTNFSRLDKAVSALLMTHSGRKPAQAQVESGIWPDHRDAFMVQPPKHKVPALPVLTESEIIAGLKTKDVLRDPLDRVSDEFAVSEEFAPRVEFWLKIYTEYGSNHHVIHHTRYPWIVYEVMDFTDLVSSGKGPKWLRIERSRRAVAHQRTVYRRALLALAKKPRPAKPNPLQARLIELLQEVPGPRKKVYSQAAQSLRSQTGQRDFFVRGLKRSTQYLPYMEEIFANMGLPKELTRLPFVESSFNEEALSKVGASGIWQVMPSTGRAYVRVSAKIDERNSPIKASTVAGRVLRSYNGALGSWPLAVTAYNNGIGNIKVAMRKARSAKIETIISRYHDGDFKFASSNFYACFLAALYADKYHEVFFPWVERMPLLAHDRIQLRKSLPVRHILRTSGLSPRELYRYNRDLVSLRSNQQVGSLPAGYQLYLPAGTAQEVAERLGQAAVNKPVLQPSLSLLEIKDVQKRLVDDRDSG